MERNSLFEEVAPYVDIIIDKYHSRYPFFHADMYQESCLAVLECLEEYNPETVPLMTFVEPYIRERLSKMVSKNVHKTNKYYSKKLSQVEKSINFFNAQKIAWTVTDISMKTGIAEKLVKHILDHMLALDKSSSLKEDTEVLKATCNHGTTENDYFSTKVKTLVDDAVAKLSETQQQIIKHLFGLNGVPQMKVSTIAHELDLEESSVRKEYYNSMVSMKRNPTIFHIA